jgi:hypothetical protein
LSYELETYLCQQAFSDSCFRMRDLRQRQRASAGERENHYRSFDRAQGGELWDFLLSPGGD